MHFSSLPQLEHEFVLLRPIAAEDIQPWFRYLSQPVVYEHTSWNVQKSSELDHYVWKRDEFTESSLLRFAVALRSSNELVGTAGFHTVSAQNGTAEIAYDIAPDYWGKGIASAVCTELVNWAHTAATIVRVQATVLDSNIRSAAVLERCGFQREGLLYSYRKVRGKHGNFYMYAHVALRTDA
jgi:[ribosomal protein S5]-alanine N-acetyltransferase